jgi:hypothetical protein
MINRDLWWDSFKEDEIPSWSCPCCNKSFLKLVPDGIKVYETADSKENHKESGWHFIQTEETFIGLLQCHNSKCNQIYTMVGEVRMEIDEEADEINKTTEHNIYREYSPININPPLNIFDIPFETPYEVKNEIITAFKLFWIDKPSCGNQIRKVIEAIMDDKRIRKYSPTDKKNILSLHQRIQFFKEKKNDIVDNLLAIKWIGNSGSHLGNLETEEILDVFELLENAINQLYNSDKDRLQNIQKQILKKHGKRNNEKDRLRKGI